MLVEAGDDDEITIHYPSLWMTMIISRMLSFEDKCIWFKYNRV